MILETKEDGHSVMFVMSCDFEDDFIKLQAA